MEKILLYFSLKYSGDFDKIFKALQQKEKVDYSLQESLFQDLHAQYTTIISDDYPKSLKEINCPPFVLYYYGNLALSKDECIAVIGMRHPSDYGIRVTANFCQKLAQKGCTIVSGMALGIDTIAHQSTMNAQGKTIAVLGSGIDFCYPKRNRELYEKLKESHLVISEYPGLTVPRQMNFPKRNRIIAGLSKGILVSEAAMKSGTMITVGHGLEQGKDIFCIPGSIEGANGCNYLIQQGAKLVLNVDDILE